MSGPPPYPGPSPSTEHPVKKGPNLLLILSGCGCVGLVSFIGILGIAAFFLWVKPLVEKARAAEQAEMEAEARDRAQDESQHLSTFVNRKETLGPVLKENFIGFSFRYPASRFQVAKDGINFVKLEKNVHSEREGDLTQEDFAVGHFTMPVASSQEDQDNGYPKVLAKGRETLAAALPGLREIAQISDSVGGQRARTLLFEANMSTASKGPIKIYGKLIVTRREGQKNGVALVLIASSLQPGIESAGDVGVKGDLHTILSSFKFAE